jgi:septal ring factor EnvC (AmiA/AmiB activator)
LQGQIQKTEAEAGRLKMKLVEARVLEKEAEDTVIRRLIAMYKYTKQGYVKALGDVEAPWQFLRRVKYLKVVMAEDRDDLVRVMDLAMERRRRAKAIEKSLSEIEEVYRIEQSNLESLKIAVKEKVFRLMTTHKEKEFYELSVRRLQNTAENLDSTFLHKGKKEVVDVGVPESFEKLKGKIPFPSQGRILGGKELFKGNRQEQEKGVLVAMPAGAYVRAVFPGKVDFSGKLKGYGELIIINHGERLYTVSAHLSKRTRLEGDLVEKGDVVGVVGTDEISGAARFYFEIRKAGRSLDPLEWFALK